MTVLHELHDTDYEARGNFVNWYFHVVHDGEIYCTVLFSAATLCHLTGYENSVNNSYWFADSTEGHYMIRLVFGVLYFCRVFFVRP
jgi:hypothetical protein